VLRAAQTLGPAKDVGCFFLKVILFMVQTSGEKTTVGMVLKPLRNPWDLNDRTTSTAQLDFERTISRDFFTFNNGEEVSWNYCPGSIFYYFPTILSKSRNIFPAKNEPASFSGIRSPTILSETLPFWGCMVWPSYIDFGGV